MSNTQETNESLDQMAQGRDECEDCGKIEWNFRMVDGVCKKCQGAALEAVVETARENVQQTVNRLVESESVSNDLLSMRLDAGVR